MSKRSHLIYIIPAKIFTPRRSVPWRFHLSSTKLSLFLSFGHGYVSTANFCSSLVRRCDIWRRLGSFKRAFVVVILHCPLVRHCLRIESIPAIVFGCVGQQLLPVGIPFFGRSAICLVVITTVQRQESISPTVHNDSIHCCHAPFRVNSKNVRR